MNPYFSTVGRAAELEQILLRADHVHQRQRVAIPPGLDAFRERNV